MKNLFDKALYKFKGGEMKNFVVTVRKRAATIETESGDYAVSAKAGSRLYLLLEHFSQKGAKDSLYSICSILYLSISTISANADAAKGVLSAIKEWAGKRMDEAAVKAGKAGGFENEMDLEQVKRDVKRGEELASRQQRRKAQRETAKRMQRDAAGRFTKKHLQDEEGRNT